MNQVSRNKIESSHQALMRAE